MDRFEEKYINPFTDYGFKHNFESAEIAKFTPDQVRLYEDSLKYYRDLKNSLDTAKEEGKEEGRQEGREEGRKQRALEIARNAIAKGFAVEDIMDLTGLSKDEIEKLM